MTLERKQQGMTRENFLENYPQMADTLPQWEEMLGVFDRAGSVALSGGRFVLLIRFEQRWRVVFHNPQNESPTDTLECTLSHEAMSALIGLHSLLHKNADWETLIAEMRRGDKENESTKAINESTESKEKE